MGNGPEIWSVCSLRVHGSAQKRLRSGVSTSTCIPGTDCLKPKEQLCGGTLRFMSLPPTLAISAALHPNRLLQRNQMLTSSWLASWHRLSPEARPGKVCPTLKAATTLGACQDPSVRVWPTTPHYVRNSATTVRTFVASGEL